jgi:multiple sugar transport system ATP-binding protein
MANVKLERVRKIYADGGRIHVAVHDIDLEIADGELVVLVGPSGCGKSTTLRMIAGLETISSGRLLIGDRVVNDVPARERDIAMVFQNYALYPHMTAYENMAFALEMRKVPKREIDARVRAAAEILELEELLHRTPRQMSGGQRQRVAVGRAIVRQPRVFLFDEPLSNLDAALRVQTRREFARLHRQLGATMVYVTHDQVEAMTLGDRIVVLNEGRVQQVDTPAALYDTPRNTFVARFIGSPAMNLLRGPIVREEGLRFRDETGTFTVAIGPAWESVLAPRAGTGHGVILGVRPEHVRLSGGEHDPGDVAPMHVELVEPMGSEAYVYASIAGQDVTARLPTSDLPAPGSVVRLAFEESKLHFFDAETGERLAPPAAG